MNSEFARGSEWRRWELHIHTPDTKKNDNFNGTSLDEKWNNYYHDINEYIGNGEDPLKSIAVVAITDYLSIDNYKKVISDNRLPASIKLVLANVEMRIQPIANDSPINIHFIFNPDIIDSIESRFFSKIVFKYGSTAFSASHSELIRLGKTIDSNLNDNAAYKKGIEQFIPSFDKIQEVFLNDKELRDNTVIFVSNSSKDGVSGAVNHSDYLDSFQGDSQLKAFRQSIYKFVDGIFSSTPSDINYFLGKKTNCPAEVVTEECGALKPCIHGCDAHENNKIFEPDQHKYCWIKADPTFNGLKQIIYEPEERVCISNMKPECKPDYYVIDKVVLNDDEFSNKPIYFNDKLTCIIGGKSTGKSILLHNMAKAIDEKQVQEKESIVNTSTKELTNTSVYWADGENDGDRHIIYIPQSYLNCLSDKQEVTTEIDNMIQSVILNNENAKTAFEKMQNAIKEKRSELNVKILSLLDIHKETVALDEEKKELGDRSGIEKEIKKLQEQKDALSKDIKISEEDITKYETALTESSNRSKQITQVHDEMLSLASITDIVLPASVNSDDFSGETLRKIEEIRTQIIDEANKKWATERECLVNELLDRQKKLQNEKAEFDAVVKELQPKIQDNKAIAEFAAKILAEKDKLAAFIALNEKLKTKKSEEQAMISEIYSIPLQIKELRNDYANVINNEEAFKGHEIEFKVEVPFRKEEFLKTLETAFVIRSVKFKNTIKMDLFAEEDYTAEKLKEIIEKLLSGDLEIKVGHSIESILRDINDDWYNIKYKVVMDNDNIDVMSPGKKALVLLKLLIDLAESKCPILIDQPEDDLDNRSVFDELIPFIRRKKKERQIIVVTHNANVVLGADAEEIIIANQTGSKSENKEKRFEYRSGAIENDNPIFSTDGSIESGILNSKGIQQHICDILEGGEIAFEKRKNKYRI